MEMQIKNTSFTKVEQKLLRKMEKGNQDIQFVYSHEGKFGAAYGKEFLDTRAVIILNIWAGNQSCSGHLGEHVFNDNSLNNKNNEPLSLFFDKRIDEDISIHVKEGGIGRVLSTRDSIEVDDQVLLTYIEESKHAQLLIYDGKLNRKFAQIIASKAENKDKLRFFAMSYVSNFFPKIFNNGGEVNDREESI